MKKKIEETMRSSIFEVFEKMFYIFLEPLDDESNDYDMEAAIKLDGFLNGKIRILLSMDMAKAMIQNMLGLEEDEITTQKMEDCSKEAVNMICGNFLGKFDSTKVFNLTIPSFSMEIASIEPDKNACRMDFASDEGSVGVIFDANGRV